jgi:hypothetical protein
MRKRTNGRNFLVLWKWEEALRVRGVAVRAARRSHSGGLNAGDRMFVWAVHEEELHLLGAIRVTRGGRDWAEGRSLYGPFKIIPLKGLKWRLRFRHTPAEKLARQTPIAMQVRSRRQPTPKTVEFLTGLLSEGAESSEQLERDSKAREGKQRMVTLSRRERSRKLRTHLLATRGHRCEICGFDFVKRYGEFASHCVEIHHLEPVSLSGRQGRITSLEDLIVVCPNCHRALHQFGDSAEWKVFQRACDLG